MKLVPFYKTQKQTKTHTITCLTFFLSCAGKRLWRTETNEILTEKQILDEYCEPNGFVVEHIWMDSKKQTAYLQIDPKKTNLSDFYTWDEAITKLGKPECWRSFYFIQDKEGTEWWSTKDSFEAELSEDGSIYTLYTQILQLAV